MTALSMMKLHRITWINGSTGSKILKCIGSPPVICQTLYPASATHTSTVISPACCQQKLLHSTTPTHGAFTGTPTDSTVPKWLHTYSPCLPVPACLTMNTRSVHTESPSGLNVKKDTLLYAYKRR